MIYASWSWMVSPVLCFALLQPGGSLEQAKKLGLAKVPVHVAKDLTPAQIKAYRLADN